VGDAGFVEKSKAVMQDRIRSDRTVVLVSHSASVVGSLCDRAVWIDKGRSVAEGATAEVLGEYQKSLEKLPARA
jgi:ABC-type polysaccharide/polyol phosphate transport system ATPase subunit